MTNRKQTGAKMDAFAEALSLHGDIPRASREVGARPEYGRVLFQRMCKRLGWQAQ